MSVIDFTRETLLKFEAAYDKAREEGAESFLFKGKEMMTQYAGYMIEHLRIQLGIGERDEQ